MARLSASVRSTNTCGLSAPGTVRRRGSRAGGQHQRAVGQLPPAGQGHGLPGGVERAAGSPRAKVDALLGVELGRAQRHPLLGSGPGQVVLGQVRSVHRSGRLVAHQGHRTGEPLPAQGLGTGRPGGSRARRSPPSWERAPASGPATGSGPACGAPARGRPAVRSRNRRTGLRAGRAQSPRRCAGETGVVPGAADRVAHHQPLGQRTAVVGAAGPGREQPPPPAARASPPRRTPARAPARHRPSSPQETPFSKSGPPSALPSLPIPGVSRTSGVESTREFRARGHDRADGRRRGPSSSRGPPL